MKLIIDNQIRSKYCEGFVRGMLVTEIVIHATAGRGTLPWMIDGGKKKDGTDHVNDYKKGIGLFHYLISSDGTVTNVIDPERWVFHSHAGDHDRQSLGIELSKAEENNSDAPTEAQYSALLELLDQIVKTYPIINTVTSHDHNRRVYSGLDPKPCPGVFDWARLVDFAADHRIVIKT